VVEIRRRQLRRGQLRRLLAELGECEEDGLTLYAAPGSWPACANSLPAAYGGLLAELEEVAEAAGDSETGVACFWGEERKVMVLPPFPLAVTRCSAGWDCGPLLGMLERSYRLGIVLLRLGRYAVGVFEGERLVTSKSDTRFVKGRHKAGGQSQRRFERIREKQVRELFDEACAQVRAKFEPVERELDYVFLGGDRRTLGAFVKRCGYLRRLQDRTMKRVLAVGAPRRDALDGIIEKVFTSQVLFGVESG
jgi:hypothetical protein